MNFGQRFHFLIHTSDFRTMLSRRTSQSLQDLVANVLVDTNNFEPDKLDGHKCWDHRETKSKVPIPGIPDPEQESTDHEGNVDGWDNFNYILRFKVGDQDKLDTDS